MRVTVVGAGSVGTTLAADLAKDGHQVQVIEKDRTLAADIDPEASKLGYAIVPGDGCELSCLLAAGMGSAEVVAAVTGDDEDNLVVSLLAKQEFGVPRVVARVNHPKNQWLFNETWGVDIAVSAPQLLAALVEEAVSVGSLVRLLRLGSSQARLDEVTLSDTSPAIGRSVSQLELPRSSSIVAILRDGNLVVPRGDVSFHAGDEVLLLGTEDNDAQSLFIA